MKIARQKQSQRLRDQYGPEYERAVKEHGNQREAESKLREREKQHKKLDLKDLDQGQRDDYDRRWTEIQARFVDDPSAAVRSADHLVVEVMKVRGYPVDDFDQRAETLSVEHPETTSRYREARKIARANEDGTADTESLRHAVTSYRDLVHALVHGDERHGDERHGGGHDYDQSRGGHRGDDRRDDDRRTEDRAGDRRAEHRTDDRRADADRRADHDREHERNGHRESVPTQTQETNRETM